MTLRRNIDGTIQEFAPDVIATTTAVTAYSMAGILGIRISTAAEYYINSDSANKATMPVGVTLRSPNVESLTFTLATTLEIMSE